MVSAVTFRDLPAVSRTLGCRPRCPAPSARLRRERSEPGLPAHLGATSRPRPGIAQRLLLCPCSRRVLIRLARVAGHPRPRASEPWARTAAKQPGNFSTTLAASPSWLRTASSSVPTPQTTLPVAAATAWVGPTGAGGANLTTPSGQWPSDGTCCSCSAPTLSRAGILHWDSGASSARLRRSMPPHFSARASRAAHRLSGECERSRALVDTSEMTEGGTRT